MIDIIMSVPTRVIILIFSMILYVSFVAKIIPYFLLRPAYDVRDRGDRGLKRFVFEGGRAITYSPSFKAKKYVKQYVLSSNDGEKYIKCRIDKRIFSMKYDVVAFDSNGKVLETVQISEPIAYSGMTKAALLPADTSYVRVIVKEVNGTIVPDSCEMEYSYTRVGAFLLSSVLLTVAEALTLRSVTIFFADMLLSYTDKIGRSSPVTTVIVAALLGAALGALIVLFHRNKDTRIKK